MYFLTDDALSLSASKGNQEKWYDSALDRWYKLDQFGYEALSETVASTLLRYSNIESDAPLVNHYQAQYRTAITDRVVTTILTRQSE